MESIDRIKQSLQIFHPDLLRITDDSHKHAGHAEAGTGVTHIQIHMVSQSFHGIPTIQRHRLVYDLLKEEMNKGLHSVVLKLFSPQEIKEFSISQG